VIGGPNPFLIPGSRPGQPRPAEEPDGRAPEPPAFLPHEPALESGTRPVAPLEATVLRSTGPRSAAAPRDDPAEPGTRWRLLLPDGAEITLDQPILLGREPVAPGDVSGARPIAVRDPEKTVSKTHVLLTPADSGVRVRDLHSSNGTTLVLPGGRVPVPADGDLLVNRAATLELGRYRVRLES
jgi:hypothetical protein